jgi:hypothetical protein
LKAVFFFFSRDSPYRTAKGQAHQEADFADTDGRVGDDGKIVEGQAAGVGEQVGLVPENRV